MGKGGILICKKIKLLQTVAFTLLSMSLLQCNSLKHQHSSRENGLKKTLLLNQIKEISEDISTTGKENVQFLLEKLKTIDEEYKQLDRKLAQVETKIKKNLQKLSSKKEEETLEKAPFLSLPEDTPSPENTLPITPKEAKETPKKVKPQPALPTTSPEKPKETPKKVKPQPTLPPAATKKVKSQQPLPPASPKKTKETPKPKTTQTEKTTTSFETNNHFIGGQNFFIQGLWKESIKQLETYRTKNPKGEHYPAATYYIGRAFQELNMKKESQVFFQELLEKYPNSSFVNKIKKPVTTL